MDLETHESAARRMREYRNSLLQQDAAGRGIVNGVQRTPEEANLGSEGWKDPMMYPGLYAPSGFDLMGILIRVRTRPNPKIDLGNIDSSVSLILCDSALPDHPIVYCSETFEVLTGYMNGEILGRNCRFLQSSRFHVPLSTIDGEINNAARKLLREKIAKGEEGQARLVNYKKSGERFENLLTVVPINWDGQEAVGKRYIVGFQADATGYM